MFLILAEGIQMRLWLTLVSHKVKGLGIDIQSKNSARSDPRAYEAIRTKPKTTIFH